MYQKPVILGEASSVRDASVFAFDDVYLLPENTPSSHICCIRYEDWTYAVYFSIDGTGFEYELYDLKKDPGQLDNLLYGRKAKTYHSLANRLHKKLTEKLEKEEGLPPKMPWPKKPFP